MNPVHHSLNVTVCADAEDATQQGFDWAHDHPNVKPIRVEKVVVVRNGMVSGKPSVDFLLEDETGQQFVFLITGALLKSIPC